MISPVGRARYATAAQTTTPALIPNSLTKFAPETGSAFVANVVAVKNITASIVKIVRYALYIYKNRLFIREIIL